MTSMTGRVLRSALACICLQALPLPLATAPACAADISQSRPIDAGLARVSFLRVFDPTESLVTATIYANGTAIGESQPGTAFSVALAPGTYTFAVPNGLSDGQQAPIVRLTAGEHAYFFVDANDEYQRNYGLPTLDLEQTSAPLAKRYLVALTELPRG